MKREIVITNDGSVTIYVPDMDENYHSRYGAIQEAYHVFIKNGLALTEGKPVSILEIGFGTGLNCFITYLETLKTGQEVDYTGVEAYPVLQEEALQLNYVSQLNANDRQEVFNTLHSADWGVPVKLSEKFTLTKRQQRFEDINDKSVFDLIYFDAFGYPTQPELWSEEIFAKMYTALKDKGILVTYACRTVIKKAMQSAGFSVKKVQGPPGKREMLIAFKG
ncbi:tRNA (5-methylaminomethyl-2-thiouridine)(34)-methyltransferase MnmD [Flavobacterium suzhouense]|uniref:tRNA (5-methylaminomethyl-2-thiouridine)(34)-methyltransferase MnmD n=1 Tax=Flavobacterium suzhouense TaxID=1529638 RepID=A0ABW5NPB9_9FLAO